MTIMTKSVFVKRSFAIRPTCTKIQVDQVLKNLGAISCVKNTAFNSQEHYLSIEYDLITHSYSTLENMLVGLDVLNKKGIRQNFMSFWYEYLDTTQRDNALEPPAACCNKPPRRN